MIVWYGTPGVIGIVFSAFRKRLFGDRLSTLLARRFGFSSSSLMLLVTFSISWLASLLSFGSLIMKLASQPIQPLAMLAPRNGAEIKMTRPISCTPFPFCNLVLFGCKHVRLSHRISDRGIIRNDYRRARLEFISELVGEIRTKMQSRCQRVGIHRLAFASYPHPSRLLMFRRELAWLSCGAFEHSEHMVSKLLASA